MREHVLFTGKLKLIEVDADGGRTFSMGDERSIWVSRDIKVDTSHRVAVVSAVGGMIEIIDLEEPAQPAPIPSFERIEAVGKIVGCSYGGGNEVDPRHKLSVWMFGGVHVTGNVGICGDMDFMIWRAKYAVIRQADGRLRIERMEG